MAIWQREPDNGLIVYSDEGVSYAGRLCRQLLVNNGFVGRMGKKGYCWDNGVAESFFCRLKQAIFHWKPDETRDEAPQDVMNYIISGATVIDDMRT